MQAPSNANCRRGHLVSLCAHHRRDTARRPRSGPFSRDFSSAHLHTGAIYHELQDYRLGENEINVHIHSSLLEFVWLCFQYCRFTLFFFSPPEVDKREPTCYLVIFENSILVNAYLLHYEHTN